MSLEGIREPASAISTEMATFTGMTTQLKETSEPKMESPIRLSALLVPYLPSLKQCPVATENGLQIAAPPFSVFSFLEADL